MSATVVDSRVVEFTFDNSKFESNVKTSLGTLDKLKDSLDFDSALKGFDKIDEASKNVKMGGLNDNIETVKASFSNMEVVAITALANITNSVVNLGKKLVSSVISPITQGGWNRAMNIENAKFQLEGLKVAWEDIEDDINWGVKDTAYGLDAAAKVASQLVASQVTLGDQMKAALRGISGVAAMTNSTYEDIGRIFTTVAGNGRLMGDQLLSLSSRGLNAAAVLGEALGKTEAEIREMVSKGKIDFDTFAKAMDDAFGEHAKEGNRTFTGALSNIKAALARIGANFATPLIQNSIDVFNAIRVGVNKVNAALQPVYALASEAMGKVHDYLVKVLDSTNGWEKLEQKFKDCKLSFSDFKDKLIETAAQSNKNLLYMKDQVGGWERFVKSGALTTEVFVDTIQKMLLPTNQVAGAFNTAAVSAGEFHDVVQQVIRGDFGAGIDRVNALAAAGYDYATIQNLVNQELLGTAVSIENLTDAQMEQMGLTSEQRNMLIELREELQAGTISVEDLIEQLNKPTKIQLGVKILTNLLTAAKKVFESFTTAWNNIFNKKKGTDGFYKLLEALVSFTENLIMSEETAASLTKTFEGFFAIISIVADIIGAAFNEALRVLNELLGKSDANLFSLSGSVGEVIVKFKEWLDQNNIIKETMDKLGDGIIFVVDMFKEWIDWFKELDVVKNVVETVKDWVGNLNDKLKEWFDLGSDIEDQNDRLPDKIHKVVEKLKDWIDSFKEVPVIKDALEKLHEIADKVFTKLKDAFEKVKDKAKAFFDTFSGIAITDIKDRFENFKDIVNAAFDSPKEALQNFMDKLKELKDNVKEYLGSLNIDFSDFGEKVVNIFKGFGEFLGANYGGIAALVAGGTLFYGLQAIYNTMSLLATLNPLKPLNNITLAMNNFAKAAHIRAYGQVFEMVGNAALKLVGAVVILNSLKNAEASVDLLLKLLSVMAIVIGALDFVDGIAGSSPGLLSFATKKGTGAKLDASITNIALIMLAFSGAMLILVEALKDLQDIKVEEVEKRLGILGNLVAILYGSLIVGGIGNRLAGKGNNGYATALTIVALAGAIWVIVDALDNLASIDVQKLESGIQEIGKLIMLLAAFLGVNNITGGSRYFSIGKLNFGKYGSGSNNSTALTLLAMAAALEIIVDVIRRISKMDTGEVNTAIQVIGKIIALFSLYNSTTLLTGKNSGKAGLGVLGMGVGILAIVEAIKILSDMDTNSMWKAYGVISAIAGLIVLVLGISNLTGKGGGGQYAARSGVMLLAMAGALILIVGALWILTTIDQSKLWSAAGVITIMMSIFGILIFAVSKVGEQTKALSIIIALAAIVVALAGVLYVMSLLKVDNALENAGALAILMGTLAVVMLVLSKLKNSVKKEVLGQIATLGVIMVILAGVLGVMSYMGVQNGIANAAALLILMVALVAAFMVLQKADKLEEGVLLQVGLLSGIFLVLATALGYLNSMGVQNGIANATALGILMVALAGAMFILSKSEFSKSQLTQVLIGMTVLTGIMECLALILAQMQSMGVKASIDNVLALVLLLESMAAALWILSYSEFNNWEQWGQAVLGMAVLTAILEGLVLVLYTLNVLDVQASAGNVLALVVLLEAMAVAMVILSYAEFQNIEGLLVTEAGMAILLLIMAGIGLVLLELQALDVQANLDTVLALSELLLAMSAAMILLEVAGIGGPAALIGATSLLLVMVEVGALAAGIGAFMEKHSEMQDFIDKGLPVLSQIAGGIGEIFGSLVSGFLESVGEGLISLADDLASFGEKIGPFLDAARNIDNDVVSGVTNLAAIVLLLSASDLISGIASLLGSEKTTLSDFGAELEGLAEHLVNFSQILEEGEFNETKVALAALAASMISEVYNNLPFEGGVISKVIGEKDFEGFATGLGDFAEGIVTFNEKLGDVTINEPQVESAVNAAKLVAGLEGELKGHGGLMQTVLGDQTLSQFAAGMGSFASGIVKFHEKMDGVEINEELVQSAVNSATLVAELENKLKDHNGLMQTILGDASLKDFATGLEYFGKGMTNLKLYMPTSIDEGLVTSCANAASAIAELESGLTEHDGVLQFFTGDQTIEDFGKNLASFGSNFKSYYDSINGIEDWTPFENVVTAFRALAEADSYSVELEGGSGYNLETMGPHLVTFGSYFAQYYDYIKGMVTTKLTNATTAFTNLIAAFKDVDADKMTLFSNGLVAIANEGISGFVAAFNDAAVNEAVTAANTFMDGLLNGINSYDNLMNMTIATDNLINAVVTEFVNKEDDITLLGTGIDGAIANGITTSVEIVEGAVSTLVSDLVNVFSSAHEENIKTSGQNFMLAFTLGLKNKSSEINSVFSGALKEVRSDIEVLAGDFAGYGQQLKEAFSGSIGSLTDTSSSTVSSFYSSFYQIGRDMCDGLIAGIQSKDSQVGRAARLIGMTLISELRYTLNEHSPSKEAYEIGDYFGIGLINALVDSTKGVDKAAQIVGDDMINSFTNSVGKIMQLLDMGVEINPVITPVLDLTEIQNGIDTMNYMLGQEDYSVNGTGDMAYYAQQRFDSQQEAQSQITMAILDLKRTMEEMSLVPSNVYNNTFNVTGDDPAAIADEISDIFQHEIDRGGAVWA